MAVGADKTANLANASKHIAAAAQEAKMVVLPECFNCPYGGKYFPEYAEELNETSPTYTMLSEAAKSNGVWLVGGSVPERDDGKLYNTSLVFNGEGALVGKHRKVHLFDISIPGGITFKESDTLSPGSAYTVVDLGGGNKMGVGICYDVRFPELAQVYRHTHGCQLLVYPGAFNMTTGPKHWELLMRSRANDNQLYVAAVSPARDTTADYVAWGHSMLVDPWAEVKVQADEKESIVYSEIDFSVAAAARAQVPTSLQRREDMYTVKGVGQ
jgi:omega-amidase